MWLIVAFSCSASVKRQRSRELLRTVFVCHRVPFLIPQGPAMPGGEAACGGGSRCKARLRRFFIFFPLLLSKWRSWGRGGWGCNEACLIPEIQDSESREPTAPSPRAPAGHFLQILCNHNVFRVKKAFQGREPHELGCGAEYKGAVSPPALSASRWKVSCP